MQAAGGTLHGIALRSDGKVVGWGTNSSHQADLHTLPTGLAFTSIAAGQDHTVALQSDGTVACWGDDSPGVCTPTPLPPGVVYRHVDAGWSSAPRSVPTAH
ncbi:MAG: hypothetical protein IPK26_30305 [Planctomycetes bacterium]|nr:hypothetical protein [Planctomycetota bacterium]